jgi:hypothetical protein
MASRAADIRDALLVVLAVAAAAILVPGLPFVGLPLAGAGLAWLAYRRGMWWSVGVGVLGALLSVLAGPTQVLFALPAMLAAGPLTVWLLRRWPAQRVVLVVTVLFALATVLPYVAVAVATGRTTLAVINADYASSVTTFTAAFSQAGPAAKSTVQSMQRTLLLLWPAVLLYPSMIAGLLTVAAVTWTARRLSVPTNRLPRLAAYDASPHWVWPTIAGLALLAIAAFMAQPNGLAEAIGLNLLLIVRPVLFLQGAGVFAAIFDRVSAPRPVVVLGIAGLFALELIFPVMTMLGLADLFANLRRLDRPGAGQPPKKVEIGG